MTRIRWSALVAVWIPVFGQAAASSPGAPVTLDSDTLEIVDNGARSIFSGHVVLKQDDSVVYADRMVRSGQDGPVVATGRVRGISRGEKKDQQVEILGTKARYEPVLKQVFVWGSPRVTVHVKDDQGRADFESDEAQANLADKEARLTRRVRGRITPKQAMPSAHPGEVKKP